MLLWLKIECKFRTFDTPVNLRKGLAKYLSHFFEFRLGPNLILLAGHRLVSYRRLQNVCQKRKKARQQNRKAFDTRRAALIIIIIYVRNYLCIMDNNVTICVIIMYTRLYECQWLVSEHGLGMLILCNNDKFN